MAHPSAFNSDAPPPRKQLQLVVHAGPLAGKGFPIIGDTLTFGRDPENDITLDDSQVSRFHARLIRKDDEISVEDLGSTNGTMVNGNRITGQQVLQPADIIGIGISVFGVKGFSAPNSLGVTQVSPEPATFTPPRPAPNPQPPGPAMPQPQVGPPRHTPPPFPVAKPQPQAEGSRLPLLAIGGIAALIVTILLIAALTAYFLNQGASPTTEIPTVIISAPIDNSQVNMNQPLTVQATGSAASGVKRMELWVRGVKTNEAVSPAADGQPTLTASFQWTPEAPGSYTLEVRAYTAQGLVSSPTGVAITVIDPNQTEDENATPTATPEPIETVSGNPSLTTRTDLNVRGGPGIEYDLLGLLPSGTEAEIIGRDDTRQWWQIRFDPAADGRGWVAADSAFSTSANVENVPIAQPPPTPTGTPTATTVPPTHTPVPTATSPAPTETPTATVSAATETPTSTPTSVGPQIDFNISPTSIQGGDCVTITWNVAEVKEVYLDGNGVSGTGNIQDCPQESKTYRLRVVKQDDSEQIQEIRVEVINPVSIKSSGVIVIEKNETIDIDDGDIPGDDFVWDVDDDDGDRRFRIIDDARLAPMPNIGSLSQLSRSACLNANYDAYSYIDASNSAPDPNNTLIDGRSACFKTNKNRIGKLRFPEYSTDDLKIEWLTWQ